MSGRKPRTAVSILGAVQRTHGALAVDCDYAKYAGLPAIDVDLKDAQAARRALDRHIEWLVNLAGERAGQIEAGTWPNSLDGEAS